jgi:hypothetical protein
MSTNAVNMINIGDVFVIGGNTFTIIAIYPDGKFKLDTGCIVGEHVPVDWFNKRVYSERRGEGH